MKIQGSLGGADALPPYLLDLLLRQQQGAGPLARGMSPMGGDFAGMPDPLAAGRAGMPGGTNPPPMPMQPMAPEPMVADAPREPLRLTVRPQQSLPLPPQRPAGLLDMAASQPPATAPRPQGGILDPGRPPPVPATPAAAFAPVGTGMPQPPQMRGQVLPLPPERPPQFSAPPGGPNPDGAIMLDIARGGPGILGGMGAASSAGILGGSDLTALANMPTPPLSLLDMNSLGGLFPSFFGGW